MESLGRVVAPARPWYLPQPVFPLPPHIQFYVTTTTSLPIQGVQLATEWCLRCVLSCLWHLSGWHRRKAGTKGLPWWEHRHILLLSSPRSGSTLLLRLIASLSPALTHGEVLNPAFGVYGNVHRRSLWRQRIHLQAVLRGSSWHYCKAMLAMLLPRGWISALVPHWSISKVFHYHLCRPGPSMAELLAWVPLTKVVLIFRRNAFATYVSLQRAFLEDSWMVGTKEERQRELSLITIEPEDFLDWLDDETLYWEEQLSHLKQHGIPTLALCYEDMTADLEGTRDQIARFIDRGEEVSVANSKTALRTNSADWPKQQRLVPLSDCVSNFEMIARYGLDRYTLSVDPFTLTVSVGRPFDVS